MNEPMMTGIALGVVGLFGSALCSGLEMGFYCINRVRLRLRAGESPPDAAAVAVQQELDEPDRLLTTLLIWNNVFNNMGALGLSMALLSMGFSEGWVVGLQTLALTPVLLVFGESLPKELFRVGADRFSYRLVWLVRVLRVLCWPVMVLVVLLARGASRAFGGQKATPDRRSQIAWMLKEGATHGAISEVQASLVDEAMELSRTTVGRHAVPLTASVSVASAADRARVAAAVQRAARDPVVVMRERGRVEGLISGVPDAGKGWPVRTPLRIDENVTVREGLSRMSAAGAREAVVTRGSLDIGLITTRRLIEPLLDSLVKDVK